MKIIFHEDQKLFRKGLVPENSVKGGPGVNSNPYLWNPKGVRSYTGRRCASFKFAFPNWVNFVTFVTVFQSPGGLPGTKIFKKRNGFCILFLLPHDLFVEPIESRCISLHLTEVHSRKLILSLKMDSYMVC